MIVARRQASWVERRDALVPAQRLLWILPFFVLYAMVRWPQGRILHLIGAAIALGALAWAIARPGPALIALVVFVPLQAVGFGFLLGLHFPQDILRPAGGLKEILGAGILVAAAHALRVNRVTGGPPGLDGIDKAVLFYVAVVTVYLVAPHLFTSVPVTPKWTARLLSWRADCGYPLLFFGVRHAPISPQIRRAFVRAVLGIAALTVAVGVYQWARPDGYTRLVVNAGHQIQYQVSVLRIDPATVSRNLGYLVNRNPLRIGSIFLGPFDMADFLLIAFGIAVERIARQDQSRLAYVLGAGIIAALFASRVRADALALVVVVVVALVPAPKRTAAARARLLVALGVAAAIVVPSLGGTRFTNAQGGAVSNKGHVNELTAGLTELQQHPFGLGIANVAGVGDRFVLSKTQQGAFTVDNSALQVGDELGIQALVPWLFMTVLVWIALSRAARHGDAFAGGARLAFLGVLVAGMYHHVFLSVAVSWVLWSAVGLALNDGGNSGPQDDQDGPSSIAHRPAGASRS